MASVHTFATAEHLTLCSLVDCVDYQVPVGRCFSPPQLWPDDPQWGANDVLDECVNETHFRRSFYESIDGSCARKTSVFELPIGACVGGGARADHHLNEDEAANNADEELCRAHAAAQADRTYRPPSGVLKYPYLVPAGPYEQCWDWDSVFLGTATLPYGSRPYLAGSMQNFFAATNITTGRVTGCLTTTLPTVCSSSPSEHDALTHAKPILIQGAWLAASATGGSPSAFRPFAPAMEALLAFWDRPPRRDPHTSLRTWHDQLETGADNGVLSRCPSHRSPACWSASQAYSLASADVLVLLHREHTAYALFREAWAAEDDVAHNEREAWAAEDDVTHDEREAWADDDVAIDVAHDDAARRRAADVAHDDAAHRREEHRLVAARHRARADALRQTLNQRLWRGDLGYHVAYNVSDRTPILAKTYVIGLPLWGGLVNASQADAIAATLRSDAMLSSAGLRSASADDPRYNNDDIIVPYSNWRGPMWFNANALACYGLAAYGHRELALEIATRSTAALAHDLRHGGAWHEAYSTGDPSRGGTSGKPLAAAGFLSWDTLSASLVSNLRRGVDPFRLERRR